MPRESNDRLIRHAALGALIGAAVGAGAAVYAPRGAAVPANAGAPPAPTSTATAPPPPSQPSPAIASQRASIESMPIATNGVVTPRRHDAAASKPTPPPRPTAAAPDSPTAVLARARSLADRQDVVGLIALRETVVRAAEQRGDADSAGVKSVLDEVDQRLNDARMMRLKSDAEQFRRAAAPKELR